ncbi:MAG: DNA-processing protein DprA [Treponema sp.]|jgi:DNA processing protein|nr:DNA-processing protein DprA [Treponema sp.]
MARAIITDLIISRIPGIKGGDAKKLCLKFENPDDFLLYSKKDLEFFLRHALGAFSWDEVFALAEKDGEAARKQGIKLASLRDEEYPALLREIYDPPAVIFYRGLLPNQEKPLAAIVGTRKPSSGAAAQAYALGRDLGRMGIGVASGLALGIDSMAQRGNIEGGGAAAAVLGSGPDMIYPASNRPLARRILQGGGVVLSEYPPGTVPQKWHFPARNRIISALARGCVIVEAPAKSGALITAGFVLEQGRDIWIASSGLSAVYGEGTSRLAEEGAKVISSAREIAEEWNLTPSGETAEKEVPAESGADFPAASFAEKLAAKLAENLNIKL